MSRDELQAENSSESCMLCGKFGHWYSSHNVDGYVKSNQPLFDTAITAPAPFAKTEYKLNRNTVKFNTACVMRDVQNQTSVFKRPSIGPMVAKGAPKYAIGHSHTWALYFHLLPRWTSDFDPIPSEFFRAHFCSTVQAIIRVTNAVSKYQFSIPPMPQMELYFKFSI